MSTEEESQAIEQVLSALYCRPIFNDFRKPVEVAYPDIVKEYFSLIKCPTDLGSMLVMAKNDELTVDELRRGLRLVSENCINFNGDLSIMKNISAHLDVFAGGLFEEILNEPFRNEDIFPLGGKDITFQASRLKNRRERFEFVQSEDLNESELKRLLIIFHDDLTPSAVSTDDALRSLVQHSIDEVTKMLYEAEGETDEFYTKEYTALADILAPFVELCSATSPSAQDIVTLPGVIPADRTVLQKYASFIHTLDASMGVLAVFVQERLMRGNSYSTRWVRPANTIVWAQAPKDGRGRASWWPAFIVASSSKLFPLQPRMSVINIKRLELDIRRALHKLRPRSNVHNGATAAAAAEKAASLMNTSLLTVNGAPTNPTEKVLSAKALSALANAFTKDSELLCPEGYLLVEFFGSHDFGWVKADTCSPFTVQHGEDGAAPTHSLPILSPAQQGKAVVYCTEAVIKQAIAAALYLEDTIMHCGEAVEEDLDISLPSQSELEDSLNSTLDLNINYHALLSGKQINPFYDANHIFTVAVAVSKSKQQPGGGANGGSGVKRKSSAAEGESAKKKGTTSLIVTSPPAAVSNHHYAEQITSPSQTALEGSAQLSPSVAVAVAGQSGSISTSKQTPVEDYERCIVKGIFKSSNVPLVHPRTNPTSYQTQSFHFNSESQFVVHVEQSVKDCATEVLVKSEQSSHYKDNAIARVKAAGYYMEHCKPLNFQHYTATRHNRATLVIANKHNGTTFATPGEVYATSENKTGSAKKKTPSSSAAAAAGVKIVLPHYNNTSNNTNNSNNTTISTSDDVKMEVDDTTTTNNTSSTPTTTMIKSTTGEKRKYVFKALKPSPGGPAPSPQINTTNSTATKEKKNPGERSYNNTHLTPRGTNCFNLNRPTGCSQYFKGDGTVHTRTVDMNGDVFHLEHKSKEKRKELLRVELASIKKALGELQALAAARGDVVVSKRETSVQNESKTNTMSQKIKINKVVAGSHKSILSPIKAPAPVKVVKAAVVKATPVPKAPQPSVSQLIRATPSSAGGSSGVITTTNNQNGKVNSVMNNNTDITSASSTANITTTSDTTSTIPVITSPEVAAPILAPVEPEPVEPFVLPPPLPRKGIIAQYQKQLADGQAPVIAVGGVKANKRKPLTASSMLPF